MKKTSLLELDIDAFSAGQIQSKIWLVETLEECLDPDVRPQSIWLLAGWYGLINLLIRARGCIPVSLVRSFDTDPECESIADKINNLWEWQNWQFKAFTKDINEIDWSSPPDIVINSSVEHLTTKEWFWKIPPGTIVALQASNLDHDDHIAEYMSLEDLTREFPVEQELYSGTRVFDFGNGPVDRYMLIGRK